MNAKSVAVPEREGPANWDDIEGVCAPHQTGHLFGHSAALAQFEAELAAGTLHHAWLVNGPRGIGKATFAYQAARQLFSQTSDMSEDVARSKIANAGHANLLHLTRPWDDKTKKFKTGLSVNEVRRTVSFFGKTAGEGAWRVCIVDTADDMNANAANALLKILEEPPAKTVFFVLANSAGRLLPTIRSRCRSMPLRPLADDDLRLVLEQAGQMPDGDFETLARLAAGSARRAIVLQNQDGLKLFDKFQALVKPGGFEWTRAHAMADDLARANRQAQYDLMLEFAEDHVADVIRTQATQLKGQISSGNQEPVQAQIQALDGLARLIKVWEKTSAEASLARQYNLDKKQVLLNLFGAFGNAAV